MRAGQLDRRITIERAVETIDQAGVPTLTWAPLAFLRAEIVKGGTTEAVRDFGAEAETATVFRTRYVDGITVADRVVYRGAVHEITGIAEIGRRRGLELRTIERAAS